MATDLRRIPGVERGRRSRRRDRPASPRFPGPVGEPLGPRPRRRPRVPGFVRVSRRLRLSRSDLGLGALVVATVLVIAFVAVRANRIDVEVVGLEGGTRFTTADVLVVRGTVSPADRLDRAVFTLHGPRGEADPPGELEIDDGEFEWRPGPLAQGDYRFTLTIPRPVLPDASWSWSFSVDATGPQISVPPLLDPVPMHAPVVVAGSVDPDATLTVNGEPVDLDARGGFELKFDAPPAGPLALVATDPTGNRSTAEVIVPIEYPPTRGVHVTAAAWTDPGLRAHVIGLVESGKINAVELDLKDESGHVGHATRVPLAREIGAADDLFDLAETVAWFHGRDVRVIGRLVAFRDPLLADAAWEGGRRDQVIQTPDGAPVSTYGGFTNFAHPEVQQYNIDVALEAARAGVDDVLYDYVRRPDGPLTSMVIPSMKGTPDEAVAEFLSASHELLRAEGVYQGVSVFGIAATRGDQIAQDVPSIARHADYLSPMLYPSHWNPGEFNLDNPNAHPYDVAIRALDQFKAAVAGTGKPLVPWLQDFSLGLPYGPDEVRAQIEAAERQGVRGWLLWDPYVTYTVEAL